MDLGMIGLGRMGGNMARRLLRGGHRVVGCDRGAEAVRALAAEGGDGRGVARGARREAAAPRAVWLMVPAGAADRGGDAGASAERLEPGDVVIDGGNTFFEDDVRRARLLAAKRHPPPRRGHERRRVRARARLLPHGGRRPRRVRPARADLPDARARAARRRRPRPVATPGGARRRATCTAARTAPGHFVKMIHNGIEYGLMQAYAEGFDVLRGAAGAGVPRGAPLRPRPAGDRRAVAARERRRVLAARPVRGGARRGPAPRRLHRRGGGLRRGALDGATPRSRRGCRPRCSPRRSSPASARARRAPSARSSSRPCGGSSAATPRRRAAGARRERRRGAGCGPAIPAPSWCSARWAISPGGSSCRRSTTCARTGSCRASSPSSAWPAARSTTTPTARTATRRAARVRDAPGGRGALGGLRRAHPLRAGRLRGSRDVPARSAPRSRTPRRDHGTAGNALFYLATPPAEFGAIVRGLGAAGLSREDAGWRRVVIEKPFGHDLESARALNRELTPRAPRAADLPDRPLPREGDGPEPDGASGSPTACSSRSGTGATWTTCRSRSAEELGVEGRGDYYEQAGALRDMVQNHIFQLLTLVAMEPPSTLAPEAVRNEKVKVLDAIRPMSPEQVLRDTVRGQYGDGARGRARRCPATARSPGSRPRRRSRPSPR